jgi:hypothetical protein
MGVLPGTGTEISLGRMAAALGVVATSTTQVALNAQVGTGRNRARGAGGDAQGFQTSIASGSATREGTDFGGLTTNNTY